MGFPPKISPLENRIKRRIFITLNWRYSRIALLYFTKQIQYPGKVNFIELSVNLLGCKLLSLTKYTNSISILKTRVLFCFQTLCTLIDPFCWANYCVILLSSAHPDHYKAQKICFRLREISHNN